MNGKIILDHGATSTAMLAAIDKDFVAVFHDKEFLFCEPWVPDTDFLSLVNGGDQEFRQSEATSHD